MRGDTCIVWDTTKNTIITDDDWEHFINPNDERGDESDDPQDMNSTMFPKPSIKRQILTDGIGTINQLKKSKTKSIVASVKEDMHSLAELMSYKSTATSHAIDNPTLIKKGEMYNYFVNMFLKKDIQQVFLKMPTEEAPKSWIEY
ncbi:hypothetical protein R3W88_031717 [Solanum pinnatisectum]|uniref:Uncharacterized protein n=1 Tax=Solanum pinnatisectum TaxID=50273 RepID=A0AAV9LQU6_9SOLN|nr:hypothetical protein R3W88_031717 [Solanum pinnatisectum]